MKNILRSLALLSLSYSLVSCDDTSVGKGILTDCDDCCDSIKDTEIINEEDRGTVCIYLMIYSYRDEIYSLCECCLCDKAPVAVDCSGNNLCEDYSCMEDFFKNAEYLFSVE